MKERRAGPPNRTAQLESLFRDPAVPGPMPSFHSGPIGIASGAYAWVGGRGRGASRCYHGTVPMGWVRMFLITSPPRLTLILCQFGLIVLLGMVCWSVDRCMIHLQAGTEKMSTQGSEEAMQYLAASRSCERHT